jgi:hypothetical protein
MVELVFGDFGCGGPEGMEACKSSLLTEGLRCWHPRWPWHQAMTVNSAIATDVAMQAASDLSFSHPPLSKSSLGIAAMPVNSCFDEESKGNHR